MSQVAGRLEPGWLWKPVMETAAALCGSVYYTRAGRTCDRPDAERLAYPNGCFIKGQQWWSGLSCHFITGSLFDSWNPLTSQGREERSSERLWRRSRPEDSGLGDNSHTHAANQCRLVTTASFHYTCFTYTLPSPSNSPSLTKHSFQGLSRLLNKKMNQPIHQANYIIFSTDFWLLLTMKFKMKIYTLLTNKAD